MRKASGYLMSGLVILALIGLAAATGRESAAGVICRVLNNIQWLLFMITGGIGIVVIALQGIKWAGSAEDPGARKSAKQGIIHAVIGMIIVLIAVWVVGLVFSGGRCTSGWGS
jgi:hypothetical protein